MSMTTKDKVKKVYDFLKKNCKTYKEKIILHPELEVTVEYDIIYDDYFIYEIVSEKPKFSKTFKEVFRLYLDDDIEKYSAYIDYDKYIGIRIDKLQKEFDDLIEDFNDDPHIFNLFLEYDNWTECWKNVSVEFEEDKIPKIQLTSEYSAIIDKKNKIVKVGCQNIPIENVRKVIEEYDKI